jgi:hypothetical protein
VEHVQTDRAVASFESIESTIIKCAVWDASLWGNDQPSYQDVRQEKTENDNRTFVYESSCYQGGSKNGTFDILGLQAGTQYLLRCVTNSSLSDVANFTTAKLPSVAKVLGCGTNEGNVTKNCSTTGGATLTIIGTDFDASDTENVPSVNGVACNFTTAPSATHAYCTLPEGDGVDYQLTFQKSTLLGAVSYAEPSISSISNSACKPLQGEDAQFECGRAEAKITITGSNFGRPNATVLIAGEKCADVLHKNNTSHSELSCTLKAARFNQDIKSVLIIPSSLAKSLSQPVQVKHKPCPPGSQMNPNNEAECDQCPAGSYRNETSWESCQPCDGLVQRNGTECQPCPDKAVLKGDMCTCQDRYFRD